MYLEVKATKTGIKNTRKEQIHRKPEEKKDQVHLES
jgi:hypothetical protein